MILSLSLSLPLSLFHSFFISFHPILYLLLHSFYIIFSYVPELSSPVLFRPCCLRYFFLSFSSFCDCLLVFRFGFSLSSLSFVCHLWIVLKRLYLFFSFNFTLSLSLSLSLSHKAFRSGHNIGCLLESCIGKRMQNEEKGRDCQWSMMRNTMIWVQTCETFTFTFPLSLILSRHMWVWNWLQGIPEYIEYPSEPLDLYW